MQNKLQELTDKLYNEGLSKGKQEGEAIIAQARSQAEEIIAKAKEEAEAIIAQARKDAEDLETKVNGDLKMAANQSIAATKQDIENLIVSKLVNKNTETALSSSEFIKEIIKSVAEKFTLEGPADLEIILPESMKKETEAFVKNELSKILNTGIKAEFSKKISGGFTIGPKDGSYFISFTEETFNELISGYLRPATKKILFG